MCSESVIKIGRGGVAIGKREQQKKDENASNEQFEADGKQALVE